MSQTKVTTTLPPAILQFYTFINLSKSSHKILGYSFIAIEKKSGEGHHYFVQKILGLMSSKLSLISHSSESQKHKASKKIKSLVGLL